jgi:hypothetical protein
MNTAVSELTATPLAQWLMPTPKHLRMMVEKAPRTLAASNGSANLLAFMNRVTEQLGLPPMHQLIDMLKDEGDNFENAIAVMLRDDG